MSVKEKSPQDHKEKAVKGSQVKTVVLLEQQRIVVACPKCKEIQLNVGSNFCSNCGEPLKWDNIEIVKPPKPEELKQEEPVVEVDAKPLN